MTKDQKGVEKMIMPILIIVLSVMLIVSVIKWASYYYACCALMYYLETKHGEQLNGGDIKDILLERGKRKTDYKSKK